ncbi:PIG-L deacetylase family protein [Actinoalloteichus hymeniacidonis]|uniref:GlcNAc-PI de-N-acetylase n=1 Tax=Actinoalloteichus hymeniacidonis TaxID=340345 RepID=A0AAC9MZX9_9PSEU|nr:PIG-L family deacetylase [Actinoalloteichus hymeniacidonis]AOS65908.1 GlcNAc-PI de-N-acetylase [Actinoalloteichus hymeniacidonis]MBB5905996.1 LmbE family N-acetylglucosaminyl deacetylase [Actinoalloteichus hymeniacidonis]
MWGPRLTGLRELTVLGAHCDDIAIGAGGTLLRLCQANPGLRITALVFTGADTAREIEEKAALADFCPGARLDLRVLALPDGRLPEHWKTVKDELEALRTDCEPDVVIAPAPHDQHQDHRTIAELVPTVFRGPQLLGYEILKWDADLAQPAVFLPISAAVATRKAELLMRHYPSQHDRTWFRQETFLALASVRGVQSRSTYAEAFFTNKIVVEGIDSCEF